MPPTLSSLRCGIAQAHGAFCEVCFASSTSEVDALGVRQVAFAYPGAAPTLDNSVLICSSCETLMGDCPFAMFMEFIQRPLPDRLKLEIGASALAVAPMRRSKLFAMRALLMNRDGAACRRCDRRVAVESPSTNAADVARVNFVVAPYEGGRFVTRNLVVVCRECNVAHSRRRAQWRAEHMERLKQRGGESLTERINDEHDHHRSSVWHSRAGLCSLCGFIVSEDSNWEPAAIKPATPGSIDEIWCGLCAAAVRLRRSDLFDQSPRRLGWNQVKTNGRCLVKLNSAQRLVFRCYMSRALTLESVAKGIYDPAFRSQLMRMGRVLPVHPSVPTPADRQYEPEVALSDQE